MTQTSNFLAIVMTGFVSAGCLASTPDEEVGDISVVPSKPMDGGPAGVGNGQDPGEIMDAYDSIVDGLDNPVGTFSASTHTWLPHVNATQHSFGFPLQHENVFTELVRAAFPYNYVVTECPNCIVASAVKHYYGEGLLNLTGSWLNGTLSHWEKAAVWETLWALTNPYAAKYIALKGAYVATSPNPPNMNDFALEAVWSSRLDDGQWRHTAYIMNTDCGPTGYTGSSLDSALPSSADAQVPPAPQCDADTYRFCSYYSPEFDNGTCLIERVYATDDHGNHLPGWTRFTQDCDEVPGYPNVYLCNGTWAITSFVNQTSAPPPPHPGGGGGNES